jgi:4-hydroxy-tetrahydrodipicolinate reductase
MIRLIVTGACGRMGATVLRLAAADPAFVVTHIIEAKDHPLVGTRMDVPGVRDATFPLEYDLAGCIDDSDVIVDFSEAKATIGHFRIAADKAKAIVVGTTGMSREAAEEMGRTKDAKAVVSPNMSIGVNLLFNLAEKAARVLGRDYDAEIIEMHHKWKKDAPSGTASRLRDVIKHVEPERAWIDVTGREGMVGERKSDEIAVLALRGGDIVGEHTVFFAGAGERIELTHRAYSRENFARGALVAAKWLVNQQNGVYDMADVLGLR